MKRAIEWVDVICSHAEISYTPSGLLDLVLAVRSEALDAAELLVRKQVVALPTSRALLEQIAEDIALMGRKAR